MVSLLFRLSVFICVLGGAYPAWASCLVYGDVVTLWFDETDKFASVQMDTTSASDNQAGLLGKFLLLNADGDMTGETINYGDQIVLRTNQDRYLLATPAGEVKADAQQVGPWEVFTVNRYNGGQNSGCLNTVSLSPYVAVALETHHGTYVSATPDGALKSDETAIDPTMIGNGSANRTMVALNKMPWVDFYYRTPVEMGAKRDFCPHMGRYDGANCFVAKDHTGNGFKYQGNVYYPGSNCPIGQWDTANCQVTFVSGLTDSFIYDNNFYVAKTTPLAVGDCQMTPFTGQPSEAWNAPLARHRARIEWRNNVNDSALGYAWRRWNKAKDRSTSCESIGSFLNWRYRCRATARPCYHP